VAWGKGRKNVLLKISGVSNIYIYMAVPHNAQATGMNVSESCHVTCVLHQQLLHLRRPPMAGSLEYRSLEVGHVIGQRKPTMTTTKLLSSGCSRD